MVYFLIYTITLFDTLSFTFGLTSVVLFIIYGHIMLKDFGYLTDEQKQEQKKVKLDVEGGTYLFTFVNIYSVLKTGCLYIHGS